MDTDVTKQLTPWSRFSPGKLTGHKLVKKLLAFCGTRMFITSFARACVEPDLAKGSVQVRGLVECFLTCQVLRRKVI